MAISLTSTNTSGAVNVNGVDVLTADAGGNVSLRTGGTVQTLPAIAGSLALGVGQTWQNLTGSRALNTTYTNNSGRPIEVSVSLNISVANGTVTTTVNGVQLTNFQLNTNGDCVIFIVPNGATYSVTANATLQIWAELRT